jgi:hypothetical protein
VPLGSLLQSLSKPDRKGGMTCDLRLAIMMILKCKPENFVVMLGVLCSTWVAINRGSSGRSWLCPMGNGASEAAANGNIMVSRQSGKECYNGYSHVCGRDFIPIKTGM